MNFIEKFLDAQRPKVQKGAKFHWLGSFFEAIDSFAFVSNKTASRKGAHIRDGIDMKRFMIIVCIALVPALLFGMYNVGYQHFLKQGVLDTMGFWQIFWEGFLVVLPRLIVSYVVGLTLEIVFAQIRNEDVNEGYFVSGLIIPLICPPDIPLWQLALAVIFAVVIGKEVFGGTGMNFMNPALVARAFLFFAYPTKMSGDMAWIYDMPEGVTGPTPLAEFAASGNSQYSLMDMVTGLIPGAVGETSFIAIMIGAAILLLTGVASWRITLSVFAGGALMGLLFNVVGTNDYMNVPFYYHFVTGGFAFGAVFMATDPVTASHTNCGKYIYGFLIGIMAVLIRVVNPAYPEGMMLAILLLNVFAPLIDYYVVEANIKRRKNRMKVSVK